MNTPTDVDQLKQTLTQRALECVQHAEQFYNIDLPHLAIDFSLRGQTAGQLCAQQSAFSSSYKIRINLKLAQANLNDFIIDVIPHEIAHFIILWTYGIQKRRGRKRIRPHGPEWQAVMLQCFERPPEIYHSFELPEKQAKTRQMKTYAYTCGCQTHELSAIRHNKITQKGTKYLCKFCHNALTPLNKIPAEFL